MKNNNNNKKKYIKKDRKKEIDVELNQFFQFLAVLTSGYSSEELSYMKFRLGSLFYFFFLFSWVKRTLLKSCASFNRFFYSSKPVKTGKLINKPGNIKRIREKKKRKLMNHKKFLIKKGVPPPVGKPAIKAEEIKVKELVKPEKLSLRQKRTRINSRRHRSPSYFRRQVKRREGVWPIFRKLLSMIDHPNEGIVAYYQKDPSTMTKILCFSAVPLKELENIPLPNRNKYMVTVNTTSFQRFVAYACRFRKNFIRQFQFKPEGEAEFRKTPLPEIFELEELILSEKDFATKYFRGNRDKKVQFQMLKKLFSDPK